MSQDHVLPFPEEKLEAIIGYCLTEPKFFFKCHTRLKAQWFTKNLLLGNIFDQLCTYYKTNAAFIASILEFKQEIFFLSQDSKEQEKYYNLIDRCEYQTKSFSLPKLERELTGFLRLSLFKESIEGAARRYKSNGFEEAYVWTKDRIREIQDAKFDDNNLVMPFTSPDTWIRQHEDRKSSCISTGNSVLDNALGGGLFKKETCAFMAGANVGKTTAMITIARNAIIREHKVLFLIHEGFPEEIRLRILSSFMAVSPATLYQWQNDKETRKHTQLASAWIDRYLKFVPYIKTNAMFIEDVVEEIKKMNTEEILQTGKGFDLIIDDYPKKLKSRFRMGSKEGLYRVETSEIYDTFNHLAAEIDAHCFVAIQTNRTGLKQNNGKLESNFLLGLEEIDESFGIAQNIANIITLNRGPEDKKRNIMRMNIPRSRNGPTDITVNTRTNYNCFLSFADANMFNLKGYPFPWATELAEGYLPSYLQEDNQKHQVDLVDNGLKDQVNKQPENLAIGVSSAGSSKAL